MDKINQSILTMPHAWMDGMKDTNIDGWMNVDTSGECMNIRWMENKWIKG